MTASMIQLIHQTELATLKTFIKICEQLNLPYIATGGTLLGAVRHQGFIPWDDDLDVAMLRKDYDTFLAKAPDILSDLPYFLQTPFSDENYGLSYAKLLNQHTYIEERNNVNYARKGIFLDIFPLDQIPDSATQLKKQLTDIRHLDSRLLLKLRYNIIDNPIRHFKAELSIEQRDTALELKKRRLEQLTKYNSTEVFPETQFKNLASQYSYEKEIFSYQQITTTELMPFEDTLITVPSDYDALLTEIYGDYHTLPPQSQRSEKHISRLIMDNQEFLA